MQTANNRTKQQVPILHVITELSHWLPETQQSAGLLAYLNCDSWLCECARCDQSHLSMLHAVPGHVLTFLLNIPDGEAKVVQIPCAF